MLLLLLACSIEGDSGRTGETGTECTLLPASDRLDLALACVDGLCGGMVYVEALAVWGEPDGCGDSPDSTRLMCTWGDLAVSFPDCDDNGLPDEEYLCDMFSQEVRVSGAWDGASAEGLGLGLPRACWEEVLGPQPDRGWDFGFNPWVRVLIEGEVVSTIVMVWEFDE